jgi:hypothetical protein
VLPPLFSSHPEGGQYALAFGPPILFGAFCGWILGVSEAVYLLLNLVAGVGGFVAGLEHVSAREGALRGLCGGLLFGTFVLVGHELSGLDAKAALPHPEVLLLILTVGLGVLLGALGGRTRARREQAAAIRSA